MKIQAEQRAIACVHRIEQKKPICVYRLVSHGGVEEALAQLSSTQETILPDSLVPCPPCSPQGYAKEARRNNMLNALKFGASKLLDSTDPAVGSLSEQDLDALMDRSTMLDGPIDKGCTGGNANLELGAQQVLQAQKLEAPFQQEALGENDDFAAFFCAEGDGTSLRDIASASDTVHGFVADVPHAEVDQQVAGHTYEHTDTCLICHDRGKLLCCDECCCTYHLECLGLEECPTSHFVCPLHQCHDCGRSADDAGFQPHPNLQPF